jgi:hypothetical protein
MNIEKLSPSELEEINKRLLDIYGRYEDKPHFKLVWSEDEFENRWMTHTNEGLELLNPEVRYVPKYRPHTRNRYILEGIRVVPTGVETDLVTKLSYEPMWTFNGKDGGYIKPIWRAIEFILKCAEEGQTGKKEILKDKTKEEQLAELEEALFGNENSVNTALSHRSGVAFGPGSSPNSSTPSFGEN